MQAEYGHLLGGHCKETREPHVAQEPEFAAPDPGTAEFDLRFVKHTGSK